MLILLRTAHFPDPGPNILQVASVLETHSVSFPIYHVYSTMCYWYADSTFEVLAEMGGARLWVEEGKQSSKKGVWRWGGADYIAYTGVTRKSLAESGGKGPDATMQANKDDAYPQQLVKIQGELVDKYEGAQKKPLSGHDLQQFPAAERQEIEKNGWNVAQFLAMVQDMPLHQKLLDDSISRAREVRKALKDVCHLPEHIIAWSWVLTANTDANHLLPC